MDCIKIQIIRQRRNLVLPVRARKDVFVKLRIEGIMFREATQSNRFLYRRFACKYFALIYVAVAFASSFER